MIDINHQAVVVKGLQVVGNYLVRTAIWSAVFCAKPGKSVDFATILVGIPIEAVQKQGSDHLCALRMKFFNVGRQSDPEIIIDFSIGDD